MEDDAALLEHVSLPATFTITALVKAAQDTGKVTSKVKLPVYAATATFLAVLFMLRTVN